MTLELEFAHALDTGRARSNNEDAVHVDDTHALAVLADGMGGYNAGDVASAMAIERLCADLTRQLAVPAQVRDDTGLRQALMAAAQRANLAVFQAAASKAEYAGMGTTLVVALFEPGRVWVGHIGDSRAYRMRAGQLVQLSRDHSLLQEQIDAGLLTPEEAAYSMNRNLVTRAVGVEPQVDLEVHDHALQIGDVVLLCSDGLSDMLPDELIAEVMRASDSLTQTAQALVAAANAAGGRDNISVILVRAKGDHAPNGRAWWSHRRS